MLKISLTVQQKKNSEDCTVKIEMPKNMDKATDPEKTVGSAVYQNVANALKQLQENK